MRIAIIPLIFLSIMVMSCSSLIGLKDYEGEDAGYIVITTLVGEGAPNDGSYLLLFRSVDEPKNVESFFYSPGNIFYTKPPDFKTDEGIGFVHVAKLKPGEYEVFQWRASNGQWSIRSQKSLITKFVIRPNLVTYGGGYMFKPILGMSLLGIPYPVNFDFSFLFDFERDYKVAVAKRSEIANLKVRRYE